MTETREDRPVDDRPRVTARTRVKPRGVPSVALLGAILVLAVAAVGLLVGNDPEDPAPVAAPSATPTPSPEPAPDTAAAAPTTAPPTTAEVPRAFVEVYNNSGVTGLADSTAGRVEDAGWKVVGVDNWYGKIQETTVYYPKKLKEQGERLAADLGVDRVRPAIEPMKFDRLTLILTDAP
ncbi:LytR family transcriptional regulator [Mumia zhuanghuii]|uniref:LytR family transcriptional regulator n=1 Tax=Mumia zhuanghuii TaxID=2585211 RepID=A0A5Q6RXY1_9ACTN|nr:MULTISPECIES: LytR C-terminal domain-containing protein [Mumia]KAA1422919.1 LytR family transcriptional regulator [Mumia zhuanghuii]